MHLEALSDATRALWEKCRFLKDDFYLAGGTALALQLGHRRSVDLDFFTLHEFSETELSTNLSTLPEFVEDGTTKWTVWGKIGQTKFSLFYYKYPLL